ncbi:hypothetical protein COL922a_004652 [Colletotrichum nupharicola]|nr:hypothetical protein COL922a_004652 [Colletotrichum nupharicola]
MLTSSSEILTTLRLRSSGLEDFTYPDSFPAPPSTLSSARPAAGDYYAWSPMSDDQQRVEEERSWLYYLAEISLRRTIKDTMAVLYRKGETYWLQNEQLLVRQYDEFEKEISQLHSHLPPLIQFDEHRHADNELAFYLQGRFQGWREATLRPLLYCALHAPREVSARVVELAQKALVRGEESVLLRHDDSCREAAGRAREGAAELEGVGQVGAEGGSAMGSRGKGRGEDEVYVGDAVQSGTGESRTRGW